MKKKSPVIRLVRTCQETKDGKCEPYRFALPCVKCGRADLVEPFGKPKENDAFDAIKQEPPDQGKTVLLCRGCAVKAKRHYYGKKKGAA